MIKKFKLFLESIDNPGNVEEISLVEFWNEFKSRSIPYTKENCNDIVSAFGDVHQLNIEDIDVENIEPGDNTISFDVFNTDGEYQMFFNSDHYLYIKYGYSFHYEEVILCFMVDIADGYNYIPEYYDVLSKIKLDIEVRFDAENDDEDDDN